MLNFAPNYKALFEANWNDAIRTANLLCSSKKRLTPKFPLSGSTLTSADEDTLDKLDAFRVRYCDLQYCIGHKLFRNLLKLEEEEVGSMLDILHVMEKRQIVASVLEWRTAREIRNAFCHDYPESQDEKAQALVAAYNSVNILITTLSNCYNYCSKYQLDISQVPKCD